MRLAEPGSDEVTVRAAADADEPAIVACVRHAYEQYVAIIGREPAPMLADYTTLIADGHVRVAVADAVVVGVIVMWPETDHLYVDNVAVAPDVQGRGVGSVLLAEAEAAARHQGRSEIRLYTNEAMAANLNYYPRRGYLETHRGLEDGYRRVYFTKQLP